MNASMDEELLTSALDGAARRVRPEALRELTVPAERAWLRRPRWSGWLAPVAAAAAVVVVAALAGGLASWNQAHQATGRGPRLGAVAMLPDGLPAYYAEVEWIDQGTDSQVVIRSTATGKVVAGIASPAGLGPVSVTVAADDRTFYALYSKYASGPAGELIVYTFRILPSGIATSPERVNGAVIAGQSGVVNLGGFAVSPDGSRLAIGAADPAVSAGHASVAGEIVVIDLRTGSHRTWVGGLDRPGQPFYIGGLSWTGDGTSLVYLAQWCPSGYVGNAVGGAFCAVDPTHPSSTPARTDSQVREIAATSDGGTLNSGPVLLRQSAHYQYIAQALIDPVGHDIVAIVQDGRYVEVVKIAVATGETVGVLYRQRYVSRPALDSYRLVTDRGHVLYAEGNGASVSMHGWIQHGRLHELAPVLRVSDPGAAWFDPTW